MDDLQYLVCRIRNIEFRKDVLNLVINGWPSIHF